MLKNIYFQLFSSSVTLRIYKSISVMISSLPEPVVCNYELLEYKNQFLEHICSKVSSFKRNAVLSDAAALPHLFLYYHHIHKIFTCSVQL